MKTKFGIMAASLLAFAGMANAQLENLQFTEVLYDSVSSNEAKFEWVEVRNTGGTDIDLDGYTFRDFGNSAPPNIPANIINVANGGDSTNTVIPAGANNVAVLYNGFRFDYNDDRFRAGWGLPSSVPVIAVDFFPSLNNSGDAQQIGLWETVADYEADTTLNDDESRQIITGFANAALHLDWRSTTPTPGFPSASGASITWTGNGDINAGANWVASVDGVNSATTAVDTFTGNAVRRNGEDFASPNSVPAGTPAPGLLITEIMVDPGEGPGQSGGAGNADFEWIEILNNTGATIDFSTTNYVFDDNDDDDLTAANITSGSVAQGATAVLFDSGTVTAADMVTIWGGSESQYIPVSDWTSMTNGGGDTIGLWSSLADYQNEAVNGQGRTTANAQSALTYGDDDGAWPDNGGGSSLYLTDLSAAAANDTAAAVAGDFNGDSVVDAEDYNIWRDNLDSTDAGILSGNGDETGSSAGVVDEADYALWVSQFGMSGITPADGTLWLRSSDNFDVPPTPGAPFLANALLSGDLGVIDYEGGDVGSPGFFAVAGAGSLNGGANVPEPTSIVLGMLGGCFLLGARRKVAKA